jgi:hypothetical protein
MADFIRTPKQWAALVAQQQRSGLSVREFAQQRDFSGSSLYAWRARLAGEKQREMAEGFIEVEVTPHPEPDRPQVDHPWASLQLAGGSVCFDRQADPRWVGQVLRAMQSC